jgi:hypothetical protein
MASAPYGVVVVVNGVETVAWSVTVGVEVVSLVVVTVSVVCVSVVCVCVWVWVSVVAVVVEVVVVSVGIAGAGTVRCELSNGAPPSAAARARVKAGRPLGTLANCCTAPWIVPFSPGWIGR